jgi:CheY-like chemotaxis protein
MTPHHVLIVDDDVDSRIVLRALLRSGGFGVSVARNGREALKWLEGRAPQDLPCAILLDLMMPVVCGEQFLDQWSDRPEAEAVPIVVVSAFPERMRAIGRKVQALVSKPIELGKVMRAVSQHCVRACTP